MVSSFLPFIRKDYTDRYLEALKEPELYPTLQLFIKNNQDADIPVQLTINPVEDGLLWYIEDRSEAFNLALEQKRLQNFPKEYGHNINNLLTVILSATQLIEMDIEEDSELHVDLKDIWSGFGKGTPSLHEMAVQSGIPGKLDVDGDAVAALWLEGNLRKIVQYNECDALTTYLVWLRLAHFAGHFTASQYAQEQALVRELVDRESSTEGREHLTAYREEWDRLEKRIEEGRGVARERSEVGR